jgi:hypothetical protein
VSAAELAEARAAELLASHLTPDQRAEWAALGRITIVKQGVLWSVLLRDVAKVLPIAALLAVPAWRTEAFFALLTVIVAFLPFWLPRFAVASAPRREWIVTARATPLLLARGRRTRFCAAFQEHLPAGDRVLAWKHVIELSEPYFLRNANIRGSWRERAEAAADARRAVPW